MSKQLKLEYPFNDTSCLEVEYRPGKWARVTANQFRSIVGNRRINEVMYDGPIYYEGTNYKYKRKADEPFRVLNVEELNKKIRRKQKPVYEEIRSYDRDARYR